jgi:hypothetical protein
MITISQESYIVPDQTESKAIAVRFPLSGQWCAANTPGHKVPSHGTDQLGQRYAYDFLQIDWNKKKGFKFYDKPAIRGLFAGVRLEEAFCWSQPIFSPFQGEVVEVRDGCRERDPVHMARDLAVLIKNALTFKADSNDDLHPVVGNHIILKGEESYALIAHARCGSIMVSQGETVKEGQQLAEVGHSSNSTAPHLHFQLMDRPQLLQAKGLPCCFKSYESYRKGEWEKVTNGIPGRRERIRA